jgi:hypothetical protein
MNHDGEFGPEKYLRVKPKDSQSFGIEGLKLKEGQWALKTIHN